MVLNYSWQVRTLSTGVSIQKFTTSNLSVIPLMSAKDIYYSPLWWSKLLNLCRIDKWKLGQILSSLQGFGMSYSKTERNWLFLVSWINSTFSRGAFQHCFLSFLLSLHRGKSGYSYFYSMFQAYLGAILWRHSWGRKLGKEEHFLEACEGRNKKWQYWLDEAHIFILKKKSGRFPNTSCLQFKMHFLLECYAFLVVNFYDLFSSFYFLKW